MPQGLRAARRAVVGECAAGTFRRDVSDLRPSLANVSGV